MTIIKMEFEILKNRKEESLIKGHKGDTIWLCHISNYPLDVIDT